MIRVEVWPRESSQRGPERRDGRFVVRDREADVLRGHAGSRVRVVHRPVERCDAQVRRAALRGHRCIRGRTANSPPPSPIAAEPTTRASASAEPTRAVNSGRTHSATRGPGASRGANDKHVETNQDDPSHKVGLGSLTQLSAGLRNAVPGNSPLVRIQLPQLPPVVSVQAGGTGLPRTGVYGCGKV